MGIDCAIVGAGPAGLAASAALRDRRIEHLVLERGRVGERWRSQQWDSLRLNNPGWMNPMLGPQPRATYLDAKEVVARLTGLAASCPVREQVAVVGLVRHRGEWLLQTSDGDVAARSVIVAGGAENVPRTPGLARVLSDRIVQLHSVNYRSPAQLPPGGVVVVGSAQSGYQIAEELRASGRSVVLATSSVGRAPARHRGRETVEWLVEYGFFDQRPQDLSDAAVTRAPQPLLAPGGRSASLQRLARSGAILAGRLVGVRGTELRFDDSAIANVATADAFAAGMRTMLDQLLPLAARSVPVEPDDAEGPVPLHPPTALDLGRQGFGTVLWATGLTGDFSWLPAALDPTSRPRDAGIASPEPGVWYVGLRWLTRRSSGNFLGFPADAAAVATAVQTYLETQTVLISPQ